MSDNSTHWVYGSGVVGCLYDNGPHCAETKEDKSCTHVRWVIDDRPRFRR